MYKHERGVVLTVCAPSGTGKTTLLTRLREEFSNFGYSISCTTRAPRGQEKDGVDYHFIDKETFKERIDKNYFAEWAFVHGNYYGTPLAGVQELLQQGRDVLLDIDVQGAQKLRTLLPGLYLFILPPSFDTLKERLCHRGTDSDDAIATRLANTAGEIALAHEFDAVIVNDDLDLAYEQLRAAYIRETLNPKLHKRFLEGLLAQTRA